MDEAITGSIDRMKEKALRNERQDKDDLLSILSLDSKSEESLYLAKAAKEVALESTGRKSCIGISIGLDYQEADDRERLRDRHDRRFQAYHAIWSVR